MYKYIFMIGSLLTIAIISIITIQWYSFQEDQPISSANSEQTSSTISQVHAISEEGKLSVKHRFSTIHGRAVTIEVPAEGGEVTCQTESGETCTPVSKGGRAFDVPSNQMVEVSYSLPVEEGQSFLNHWLPLLMAKDGSVIRYDADIMLTTDHDDQTEWISLTEQKKMEKEFVDVSFWSARNMISFPLYRTDRPYSVERSGSIMIYKEEGVKGQPWNINPSLQKWMNREPINVYISTDQPSEAGAMFSVINDGDIDRMMEFLAKSILLDQYVVPEREEETLALVASLLLNTPVGNDKNRDMASELLSGLTPEARSDFLNLVLSNETTSLTLSELDEKLSEATGNPTSFFQKNGKGQGETTSLYFHDQRKVYINRVEMDGNSDLLLYRNKLYFPLLEVAEGFGYTTTKLSDGETYIIKKGSNSWRFYLSKNFFIHNEEDYGIMSEPLKQLDGGIYLPKEWYEEIMGIHIVEKEDAVFMEE